MNELFLAKIFEGFNIGGFIGVFILFILLNELKERLNKFQEKLDKTMSQEETKHYINSKVNNLEQLTKVQLDLIKHDIDNGFHSLTEKIDHIAIKLQSILKISVRQD